MFYHGVHGGHGGKTLSQRMFAAQTHTFADSCITFMLFMFFMVRTAVLCDLCALCGKKTAVLCGKPFVLPS